MTSETKDNNPSRSGPDGNGGKQKSKSLRKRLGLSKKKDDKRDDTTGGGGALEKQSSSSGAEIIEVSSSDNDRSASRSRRRLSDSGNDGSEKSSSGKQRSSRGSRMAEGVMKRVRHKDYDTDSSSDSEHHRSPKTIVTVTSCRSDGYYNQQAPRSTSKLPRKAPTNLKLFHELAVGLKDAYAAVGQTPTKPEATMVNEETGEEVPVTTNMSEKELHGRTVLWEFIGNIDFVRVKQM
ncbi:MAG: hypothetical protein SGARI_006874 [Bacillariaceae sp.]